MGEAWEPSTKGRSFGTVVASRNTSTCFVLGAACPNSGFPHSPPRRRAALSSWPCHSACQSARQAIARPFCFTQSVAVLGRKLLQDILWCQYVPPKRRWPIYQAERRHNQVQHNIDRRPHGHLNSSVIS